MPNEKRVKILTFKNIDFVDNSPASQELFKPFNGKVFIVTRVVTRTRTVSGTISTQPTFKITNGTNDIVATVAGLNAVQGRDKNLTVVVDYPATYSAPLTLTKVVAAAGTNPVMVGDLIIEGYFL